MSDNQWVSIYDYLRCNTGFNDRNLTILRERYQQQCGGIFPELLDESAIEEVARQLNIQILTAECRQLLHDCVLISSLEDSQTLVKAAWKDRMRLQSPTTVNESDISSPSILSDIDCLLTIKMAFSKVLTFIRSFLLESIDASNTDQLSFVVDVHCPLYLFIQEQMHEHGPIRLQANRNSSRFRLVQPISRNDDFGPWSYDHWHGLFDLELEPHGNNVQFPERWCLAEDVKIHCRIETRHSNEQTSLSSSMDRPRTSNLSIFIDDICKRENLSQCESWLKALAAENIFRFEHLTSLNQSEWDRIQKLPMHAKKILKAAVDRERTSMAGERRRRVTTDPKHQTEFSTTDALQDSSMSDSKLLANLHLIKLFIWPKLGDQPALPRLEMKCLNSAFGEMRSDGFADDGLFPKIREFFLPLTISEEDLNLKRSLNQGTRLNRCKQLRENTELNLPSCWTHGNQRRTIINNKNN